MSYRGAILLMLCSLGTALAIVYTKHESRQLFIELQALNKERDVLDIDWGRLTLEQSAWATPNRIEGVARKQLRMRMPKSGEIVIATP